MMVGLLGPDGLVKSTLMSLISGARKLQQGQLTALDEPTKGVDPLSRRQFWQLIASIIRAQRPTMSILVSTAYMDEAEGFDYLIAMDAGRVLYTATPEGTKAKTHTKDLESAFVRLLPQEKRANHSKLIIPPFKKSTALPVIIAKNLTRRFGDFTAANDYYLIKSMF